MAHIDPMLALALAVQSNKGVYALLLGSGVSRPAKIPTGWEVVLDLIRKLAALKGDNCEPEPDAWFKATFKEEPDYSKLLDDLAKTPAERQQLLRAYFEPDDEEREQGFKQPTAAHKAIARLVTSGHIRVIVTTNFDHLTELAIRDAGVVPVVISSADAIAGALPLVHQKCCIIKVHGDYLDVRIRNTPAELATYEPELNKLLDRVFDEFGLIVCGWSGVWDTALRAAIERCPNRRFSMYWTAKDKPAGEAEKLITLRAGQVIPIKDADAFFTDLAEKVESLEESSRPHPLSVAVAVATLKRYLAEERHVIRLHDIMSAEIEKVYAEIFGFNYDQLVATDGSKWESAIGHHDRVTEILRPMMSAGCYWGSSEHTSLWAKCVQNLGRNPGVFRRSLRLYPSLQLIYSGGIAAMAAGKYETLAELLLKPSIRDNTATTHLQLGIQWSELRTYLRAFPEHQHQQVPVSEHLFSLLRPALQAHLPDDAEYAALFNRFEYLFALVYADLRDRTIAGAAGHWWGPVGRFGLAFFSRGSLENEFLDELKQQGQDWPPIRVGLFDGSAERARQVVAELGRFVANMSWA